MPVLAFAVLEGALRVANYGGDLHLFRRLDFLGGRYAEVNKRFAARYFVDVRLLPTPPNDLLLVRKPANGFRVFVLGESTTNGFPYGYNGTFSRVLEDALRDVLPRDSVEVVNLGIAAVNSYVLYDQVGEILAQHPDAVMMYVGQNEYYGTLGVGSTVHAVGSPALIRTYLRLQRLRVFLLARDLAVRLARALSGATGRDTAADLMEYMVRDRAIPLDGPLYRQGVAQFQDNLGAILRRFRDAGVPVFVGSLTSNLRDQPPFQSIRTGPYPAADSVYRDAQRALGRPDTVEARRLFVFAKDLDGLRFRAPSEFNRVIRAAAQAYRAYYVPVDEAFSAASTGGIPGKELFWEHVHPMQSGYLLMAKAYFGALRGAAFLGRAADTTRLRQWQAYFDRMELTEFDRQYAWHTIEALRGRWPFAARVDPAGYPANYRPADLADSAAFLAANSGLGWPQAKTALADQYRRRGQIGPALAEYRGLIREQPINVRFLGIAAELYMREADTARARDALEQSLGVQPSGLTSYLLGSLELGAKRYDRAVTRLEQALQSSPDNPPVLFDLSRACAMVGDRRRARYYADRLLEVEPAYPGLSEWRAKLDEEVKGRTSSRSR
jgi:tetratricopeptide (TPR) repeat protein